MTDKRFTVEKFTELEYGITKDGETLIGLSLDKITAKYIVEQWNDLAEENEVCKEVYNEIKSDAIRLKNENEQLKEENEFAKLLANNRGEMISFADSLIQDIDDELTQKRWYQFKEEMYQKWKKKEE